AATRQKSTARRFVSSCSVKSRTSMMVIRRSTYCHFRLAFRDSDVRLIAGHALRSPPSTAAPRAAMTSGLRGAPVARRTMRPSASSTNTVGVRTTFRRRTRSRRDSASISTCATPSTISATSPRTRRVARHGAQKALENCSRVALSPSSAPTSSRRRISSTSSSPPLRRARRTPSRRRRSRPNTVAASSTAAAANAPVIIKDNSAGRRLLPPVLFRRLVRGGSRGSGSGGDREERLPVQADDLEREQLPAREHRGAAVLAVAPVVGDVPAAERVPAAVTRDDEHPAVRPLGDPGQVQLDLRAPLLLPQQHVPLDVGLGVLRGDPLHVPLPRRRPGRRRGHGRRSGGGGRRRGVLRPEGQQ